MGSSTDPAPANGDAAPPATRVAFERLRERGEAEVDGGAAGGGKTATEIVGDVIGQGHFVVLILSTISRQVAWQAFFKM